MTPSAEPAGSRRRVPDRLDVRPLDRFRSFKVKLGVLVAASVTVAALLTQVSIRAGIEPLLALPLVVLAALVFTQLLARGMTSPLREMTGAARAMARGDYSRPVRASSRDEVGQLAAAFSTMASELEQTDRMRRDLVANVSHELRTPVAGLRAQLENLVDGVTEPDPAALEVALTETERLSLLVNHLLDLSRLDAGVVELDIEDRSSSPPSSMRWSTRPTLASGGRDVRWIIDVEPPDLMVPADAARLHQVIHNLLENAARHSPTGGRIHISAARLSRGRRRRTDRCARRGSRHRPRGSLPGVRALPARRIRGQLRRNRARIGDRALGRGTARRHDRGAGRSAHRGRRRRPLLIDPGGPAPARPTT